jgi:hypothetical protein
MPVLKEIFCFTFNPIKHFNVKVEFPDEKAGINRYFQLMSASSNMIYIHHILKVTCYFQTFPSSDYEKNGTSVQLKRQSQNFPETNEPTKNGCTK